MAFLDGKGLKKTICINCNHSYSADDLECRKKPPAVFFTGRHPITGAPQQASFFPVVDGSWWCDEFKLAED